MPKRRPNPTDAVREPVQVYLAVDDSELLTRLVDETGLTKAEILRRGIRSLAREQHGPSPMLRFLVDSNAGDWTETIGPDHDAVLASTYRSDTSRKRR